MKLHTRDMATSLLAAALCGFFGLTACNAISGASDLSIGDFDYDPGSEAIDGLGENDDTGSTETVGAGGMGSGAGEPTTTATTTTTTTTGGMGAGGPGGGGTGNSGSGAGPTDCEYPPGPYGVSKGQTVPPTLSWSCYREGGSNTVETVSMKEYFDCDGSKGINALQVDTSQFG